MLQLRERVRLARKPAGDLQRDQPPGEVALPRQVHAAERPAPEFLDEVKAHELGADVRQRPGGLLQVGEFVRFGQRAGAAPVRVAAGRGGAV